MTANEQPPLHLTYEEALVLYKTLTNPPGLARLSEAEQRTLDNLTDRLTQAVEGGVPD
jgi:hypothetical protein